MLGLTFHPCPKSLDAFAPVPFVAIPPFPFSPVKFSGLIERVLASDNRKMLLMLDSMPLNLSWPNDPTEIKRLISRQPNNFAFMLKVLIFSEFNVCYIQ